jgi:hypothetical protein
VQKFDSTGVEIWVYKKLNDQYILLDDHQPFKSKAQMTKALKISHKTVTNKLDTHICYKEFYFFSKKF